MRDGSVLITVFADTIRYLVLIFQDSVGEFKKWGKISQKGHFSLLGGEYQPSLVPEKNRTSLRKSNSPTVSFQGGSPRHCEEFSPGLPHPAGDQLPAADLRLGRSRR